MSPSTLLKAAALLVAALPLLYGCEARSESRVGLLASVAHASEASPASTLSTADLAITQAGAKSVRMTEQLTYIVIVTNHGAATASDVRATIEIPGSTVVGRPRILRGTCSAGALTVACHLGSLAPGEMFTITIVVTPAQTGTLTSTARVVAEEPDPDTGNNSDSVTTTVYPGEPGRHRPSPGGFRCPRLLRLAPTAAQTDLLARVGTADLALDARDAQVSPDDRKARRSYRPGLVAEICQPI